MEMNEKKGSVLTGFIGAFFGAMLGAVVWGLLYVGGYIASIVGVLIGFLAGKGYDLLHGRQGVARVIVIAVCVVLAVLVATVVVCMGDIHYAYQEEVDALPKIQQQFVVSEAEFFEIVLQDSEYIGAVAKDVGLGLLFAFLGAFGALKKSAPKKQKRREQTEAE